jgi:hypothetical protein
MTESAAAPAPGSRDALIATTGPRGFGLTALRPLCMLFLLLGLVQIFLAGYGVFGLHGDSDLGDAGSFDAHRQVGLVMTVVALLIVIAALLARPTWTVVLESVGLLVILAVLQGAFASLGENHGAFWGGLHALFGIGSLGLASVILAQARRFRDATTA